MVQQGLGILERMDAIMSAGKPEAAPPEDGAFIAATPDAVRRRSTDTTWVYIFILAQCIMGLCLHVAGSYGAASRLVVLRDFMQRECGVGDQIDNPFLFFCKRDSGDLAMEYPICVSTCPNSSATQHLCPTNEAKTFNLTDDYPTWEVSGLACGARDEGLRSQQRQWMAGNTHFVTKTVLMLGAWHPIVVCVLIASAGSVLYIGLLSTCASRLVYMGLFLLSVVPTIWGMVLLHWWYIGTFKSGFLYGAVLLVAGTIFCGTTCFARTKLDNAGLFIELSCKCLSSLPLLAFSSLLLLVLQCAYVAVAFRGMVQLYSLAFHNGDEGVDTTPLKACMAYVCFMLVWTYNVFDACWDTFLAYLTQIWWLSRGAGSEFKWSKRQSDHVIWTVLRYHFGTMVHGALVVGFLRPFRMVIGAITAPGRKATEFPLLGCIVQSSCVGLVDFYSNRMELLSRNAYMDVAMNGTAFWPAARAALEVIRTDNGVFTLLNGATWFFQLAGVGLVMLLGNVWAYFEYGPMMSSLIMGHRGPLIPWDQEDVGDYVALCTWISGLTALPFMLLFDTVSDTILYCTLVVKRLQPFVEAESYLSDMFSYISGMVGMGSCLGDRGKLKTRGTQVLHSPEGDTDSCSSYDSTSEEGFAEEAATCSPAGLATSISSGSTPSLRAPPRAQAPRPPQLLVALPPVRVSSTRSKPRAPLQVRPLQEPAARAPAREQTAQSLTSPLCVVTPQHALSASGDSNPRLLDHV